MALRGGQGSRPARPASPAQPKALPAPPRALPALTLAAQPLAHLTRHHRRRGSRAAEGEGAARPGAARPQDFANIMKMLRSLIQDGYIALLEQRCRSAAQAFTELLNGLEPQKIKELSEAEKPV
ncbi:uncharacterized protein LOC144252762 isoform X2 [Urocitellus parryii]